MLLCGCKHASLLHAWVCYIYITTFLANVTFAMLSPVRLSVVCNARAPYSGGCNFRQFFYGIWYLDHPLTSMEILRRSSQGHPFIGGLNTKGVAKYSDFGPIEGYISKTVQDRR